VLFCIVDSQQMGVLRKTCTDRKVSATCVSRTPTLNVNNWHEILRIILE